MVPSQSKEPIFSSVGSFKISFKFFFFSFYLLYNSRRLENKHFYRKWWIISIRMDGGTRNVQLIAGRSSTCERGCYWQFQVRNGFVGWFDDTSVTSFNDCVMMVCVCVCRWERAAGRNRYTTTLGSSSKRTSDPPRPIRIEYFSGSREIWWWCGQQNVRNRKWHFRKKIRCRGESSIKHLFVSTEIVVLWGRLYVAIRFRSTQYDGDVIWLLAPMEIIIIR